MGSPLLWFIGTAGFAAFSVLLRFALQALEGKHYRASAGWFFWSFLPLAIVCAMLVVKGEPDVSESVRNIVLGFVGAVIGASVAIWSGYTWWGVAAGTAHAQGAPSQEKPALSQQHNQGPGQQFNAPGGQIYVTPPASAPTVPQRNPNALYQFNEKVGTAVGANIMISNGSVTFAEVYGAGDFNDQQVFEYQDYVLKFISADGKSSFREAMTLIGVSINGNMQQNIVHNVICQIVGKRN